MTEYEQYVTAINKIFECTNLMKSSWSEQDNINLIENIELHKQLLIEKAQLFSNTSKPSLTEELSDD